MRTFIKLLLYLTGTFAISCSRNDGSRSENHVPILAPDATTATINPDSPVAIQGATFGGSRSEVVITFIDQKQYDAKNLAIGVRFFTRSPNGLVPTTQKAKSDMSSWGMDAAKNQIHQLRMSNVEDFARVTVDVDICSKENTLDPANEGHLASKSFDVVDGK